MTTNKPITHSYSSLAMHGQCPKQYHQVKLLKRFPYTQTPAAKRGQDIHAALESLGKTGVISPEFADMAWGFNSLVAPVPGVKRYEHSFNFDKNKVIVGARDWSKKHLTGSADVLITFDTTAVVLDWKTGRADYPKPLQLEHMAIFTMWEFPEITKVVGILVFLEHKAADKGNPIVSVTFTRDELPTYEAALNKLIGAVERDAAQDHWAPKPSKLCPWCPVQDCSHWEPIPEKRDK
jgi:PD-(D/E)XK nuclease superfamily